MRRNLRWSLLLLAAVMAGAVQPGSARGQVPGQPGYSGAPAMMVAPTVATPDFHGMTLEEAQAANLLVPAKGAAVKGGLEKPNPQKIFSSLVPRGPVDGVVDSQTPEVGTKVYPGRGVATLTMKAAMVMVPVLQGITVSEAQMRLSQSSLRLGGVDGDATQRIATQTPAAGASVAVMTAVDVVMAAPVVAVGASGETGPSKVIEVPVPDLKGLSESEAQAALKRAHLGSSFVGSPSGIVVGQTPEANTKVAEGTSVRAVMGLQEEVILIPQPQPTWPPTWMPTWGWFVAGGLALLGTVGAFVKGTKIQPNVATTMVAKPNESSAKVDMKSDPKAEWTVLLADRPAVGIAAMTSGSEISGERKESRWR